jgi:signal transduction histidine kinase
MPETTSYNIPPAASQLKHDLRNPFGQILGFSEIVIEEAQELGESEDLEKLNEICAIARELVSAIDAQFSAAGGEAHRPISEDFIRRLEARIEPGVARILEMKFHESDFASSEPQANDIRQILAAAASVRSIIDSAAARAQGVSLHREGG